MLTIAMDVMFGATLSPTNKFKFKSFESASETNLQIESSTHFTVYTIMAREKGKRPLCDTWTFMVESEEESATWVSLLRCAIHPNINDRKVNVLVLLNPVSGKRKATKIFDTIVKPIFEIGDTPYTLKLTESADYATGFLQNEDLSPYSSIVSISGDGLLHDVLNGFLQRADWPRYQTLPLAVIPAGTGNGLAKSLDCIWPEQAAVAVVKAEARPLDIMSATLASGRTEYCFLSMTWGLTADIDIESERMRWAGAARLDLYGTIRLMNLRYYGGRLHYLPAYENDESAARAMSNSSYGMGASAASSMANILAERTNHGTDDAWGLPPPSFSSPLARNSPKQLPQQLSPQVQPAVTLRPTLTGGIQLPIQDGSLPPRWKTVEGPFVQVIATNVPWLAPTFLASKHARIADGMIDLVYSGNATKWQMIPYMTGSAKEDYLNKGEGIEHVKVRAFILEPNGLRTTSKNPESHQAVQHPHMAAASIRSKSLSPRFGSIRSTLSYRSKTSTGSQVTVPARVRSQNYAAYHTASGRNSSLMAQGLKQHDQEDASQSLAVPSPAAFSTRSGTAIAQMAVEDRRPVSDPDADTVGVVRHAQSEQRELESPASPDVDGNAAENTDTGCRLVGEHGIVDLDGEVVELGPVKIEALPNLVRIICPPWLNEDRSNRTMAMPVMKAPELIRGTLSREGSFLSFASAK
ncbi:Sphingosine kinase 1 [Linderina macrospora]|uniref:Sphingosine kinase 1 n=1 Tax=Linderina macrospora TaxID=4868 RepID=A0ACC1JES0_9FUNG|nr:Sphingosine kinase 1 [Linderina macrospora]